MHSLTFQFEKSDDTAAPAMLALYDIFSQDAAFERGPQGISLSSVKMIPYILETLEGFCYTGIIEDEDAMNQIVRACREIVKQLNRKCECGHLLGTHTTRQQCKVNACECKGFQEPFEYDGALPLAE